MKTRPRRSEVPAHLTWNLDDLFPSEEAWERGMAEVVDYIPKVTQYKGRLGEGPKVLLQCIEELENLQLKFMR
ncbi:MAG: oligoendopeptidase F family protein, partial [Firmicutes bacterium]|nr:oligoendopeptidase F family protein [Candidatus Fermentithermobacillaceae bacterium]